MQKVCFPLVRKREKNVLILSDSVPDPNQHLELLFPVSLIFPSIVCLLSLPFFSFFFSFLFLNLLLNLFLASMAHVDACDAPLAAGEGRASSIGASIGSGSMHGRVHESASVVTDVSSSADALVRPECNKGVDYMWNAEMIKYAPVTPFESTYTLKKRAPVLETFIVTGEMMHSKSDELTHTALNGGRMSVAFDDKDSNKSRWSETRFLVEVYNFCTIQKMPLFFCELAAMPTKLKVMRLSFDFDFKSPRPMPSMLLEAIALVLQREMRKFFATRAEPEEPFSMPLLRGTDTACFQALEDADVFRCTAQGDGPAVLAAESEAEDKLLSSDPLDPRLAAKLSTADFLRVVVSANERKVMFALTGSGGTLVVDERNRLTKCPDCASKPFSDDACGKCKKIFGSGLHINYPYVQVDLQQWLDIREAIIEALTEAFGERPRYNTWRDVVDRAIPTNGLRMIGSHKTDDCKACDGKSVKNRMIPHPVKIGQTVLRSGVCAHCHGNGKVDAGRAYFPLFVLNGNGERQLTVEKIYKQDLFVVLRDTKIRSPLETPPTELQGFAYFEGAPRFIDSVDFTRNCPRAWYAGLRGGDGKPLLTADGRAADARKAAVPLGVHKTLAGESEQGRAILEFVRNRMGVESRNGSVTYHYESIEINKLDARGSTEAFAATSFLVSVRGPGQRWCANINGPHNHNNIYMIFKPEGATQRCHSMGCNGFQSMPVALTPSLRRILFPRVAAHMDNARGFRDTQLFANLGVPAFYVPRADDTSAADGAAGGPETQNQIHQGDEGAGAEDEGDRASISASVSVAASTPTSTSLSASGRALHLGARTTAKALEIVSASGLATYSRASTPTSLCLQKRVRATDWLSVRVLGRSTVPLLFPDLSEEALRASRLRFACSTNTEFAKMTRQMDESAQSGMQMTLDYDDDDGDGSRGLDTLYDMGFEEGEVEAELQNSEFVRQYVKAPTAAAASTVVSDGTWDSCISCRVQSA